MRSSRPMQIENAILERMRDKLQDNRYSQIYGDQLKKLRENDENWRKQVSKSTCC